MRYTRAAVLVAWLACARHAAAWGPGKEEGISTILGTNHPSTFEAGSAKLDLLRTMVKENLPQFRDAVADPAFHGPCYREWTGGLQRVLCARGAARRKNAARQPRRPCCPARSVSISECS